MIIRKTVIVIEAKMINQKGYSNILTNEKMPDVYAQFVAGTFCVFQRVFKLVLKSDDCLLHACKTVHLSFI